MDDFVDREAIKELVEKVEDTLRSLGLTLIKESVAVAAVDNEVNIMLPCIIRKIAHDKLTEDKEAREQFNAMLAHQHDAMVEAKANEIRKAAVDMETLEKFLSGEETEDECKHTRVHPDGFCLDCGKGLDTDG